MRTLEVPDPLHMTMTYDDVGLPLPELLPQLVFVNAVNLKSPCLYIGDVEIDAAGNVAEQILDCPHACFRRVGHFLRYVAG